MRIDETKHEAQAVCLAPTYELAIQNARVCNELGSGIGVEVLLAVADDSCKFARGTKDNHQIVVGTPGKVKKLIKDKVINTKSVIVFVLDEADLMVESGMCSLMTRHQKCD